MLSASIPTKEMTSFLGKFYDFKSINLDTRVDKKEKKNRKQSRS